jgi:hypothetical protein
LYEKLKPFEEKVAEDIERGKRSFTTTAREPRVFEPTSAAGPDSREAVERGWTISRILQPLNLYPKHNSGSSYAFDPFQCFLGRLLFPRTAPGRW